MNGDGVNISVEYDRKERNIDFLVKTYETKQPGEIWDKEHETKTKREWRLKQKIRYSDYVMDELNMKGVQREQVKQLLHEIPDHKKLCQKCKCEKVITVICFYIKFCTTPKLSLNHFNRYKICKKQNIPLKTYSIIVTNLAKHFQLRGTVSAVRHVI